MKVYKIINTVTGKYYSQFQNGKINYAVRERGELVCWHIDAAAKQIYKMYQHIEYTLGLNERGMGLSSSLNKIEDFIEEFKQLQIKEYELHISQDSDSSDHLKHNHAISHIHALAQLNRFCSNGTLVDLVFALKESGKNHITDILSFSDGETIFKQLQDLGIKYSFQEGFAKNLIILDEENSVAAKLMLDSSKAYFHSVAAMLDEYKKHYTEMRNRLETP